MCILILNLRPLNPIGGIEGNHALPNGLLENRMNEAMMLKYRLIREHSAILCYSLFPEREIQIVEHIRANLLQLKMADDICVNTTPILRGSTR